MACRGRRRLVVGALVGSLAATGACQQEAERTVGAAGSGRAAASSSLRLPAPAPSGATVVGLGDFHSCALSAGRVVCRGGNLYGQLGVREPPGERRALAIDAARGAIALAVGGKHACALRRDSTVICWGLDQFGQTGHDGRAPGPVAGLREVVALALGDEHS
ncbi:MAG: hypothetical protein JRI23_18045 [Deltaproteobacteria bacterium]|jgi:alpha-tubulin suppressor-like RCC1 family protein|nr:hypothetical protein [Deltaproteobacteria bacterium]MBW2533748.1 hypothetical protein [Deltaproteobacteria bacterium]